MLTNYTPYIKNLNLVSELGKEKIKKIFKNINKNETHSILKKSTHSQITNSL